MYRHGFLHRDVSIGNILRLIVPSERKAFDAIPTEKLLRQNIGRTWEALNVMTADNKQCAELVQVAQELSDTVSQLNLTLCSTVMTDGDLAARLSRHLEAGGHVDGLPVRFYDGTALLPYSDSFVGHARVHVAAAAASNGTRSPVPSRPTRRRRVLPELCPLGRGVQYPASRRIRSAGQMAPKPPRNSRRPRKSASANAWDPGMAANGGEVSALDVHPPTLDGLAEEAG